MFVSKIWARARVRDERERKKRPTRKKELGENHANETHGKHQRQLSFFFTLRLVSLGRNDDTSGNVDDSSVNLQNEHVRGRVKARKLDSIFLRRSSLLFAGGLKEGCVRFEERFILVRIVVVVFHDDVFFLRRAAPPRKVRARER